MPQLVLVEWVDASSNSSWECKHEKNHVVHCASCGILLRRDKEEVELVLSLTDNGLKNLCLAIPTSSIKRIRRVRVS